MDRGRCCHLFSIYVYSSRNYLTSFVEAEGSFVSCNAVVIISVKDRGSVMLDVIDLLEVMGTDAQWSGASRDTIKIALAKSGVAPELQAAISAEDQNKLRTLLGVSPLCAMLNPGREDEEDDEGEGEEDDSGIPSRKEEGALDRPAFVYSISAE